MMNNTLKFLVFLLASVFVVACTDNNSKKQNEAPAPLFVDPNYQGACDPEIVWNEHEQQWYIYYTARRPMLENTWLQTPIGVAVSTDMVNWRFKDTILKEGGSRNLDNSMARHCSVAVKDGLAFIFYHVKPWRRYDLEKLKGEGRKRIFDQPLKNRESVLQMAEREIRNNKLSCDRNKAFELK